MKKTLKGFVQLLQNGNSGQLKDGFVVLKNLRGGVLLPTPNKNYCQNDGTCTGTNSNVCFNNKHCEDTTNTGCTNNGVCLI